MKPTDRPFTTVRSEPTVPDLAYDRRMARYVDTVLSPWSPEQAFAYMADARNFAEWDPGVRSSALVRGEAPGPDAAFDVVVDSGGHAMTLTYEITSWEPPHRLVLTRRDPLDPVRGRGHHRAHRRRLGRDLRRAALLQSVLGVFDPLLRRSFRKIGDRAAAGLRRVLEAAPPPG